MTHNHIEHKPFHPLLQFNILNEKMYELLGQVYKEIFEMFDTDVFHMGGDEVQEKFFF